MGFMELRAGMVGFRVPSLPIFLTVITTQNLKRQKMEFRTYFVYFHTISYKFKVQRTPTEFGPPVQQKVFQIYFVKKCLLSK